MDEEPTAHPARADGVALIVAGYDGSPEAEEAVRWAASLARRIGSRLRVVWAWKLRDVWDAAVAADDEATGVHMAEMEGVAHRRLTEAVGRLVDEDGPAVDLHLRQGPDAAGILLHAARDADLLVVGSRGRGRAASAVLGSVSARCVHESAVPVLVIPRRAVGASEDHDAGAGSGDGRDRLHPV
ncbi:universal stress protein [Actinomycetospora cinnamomea]|uniref:Nucleotide-binding universal stress UspA family protein n=1 Tax=Actinomycetospora cinnamomea TaxID=663609 RepID=A0A2U1F440_9PSEU|nr:universal stress protein [Actinomycetospora cinnamomea]PVZ06941.1 nucleotide-binding universal stress UspA family protein [Actinomycetospora cinnamomea]